MIKRILFATSAIALLGAPSALAGENCRLGHTAQTAQSDAALPQSTAAGQADETTATTVAVVTTETQQQ